MPYKFGVIKEKYKVISLPLLIIALIILTVKHIDLRKSDNFGDVVSGDQWQQPSTLNEQYPQLISKYGWGFEFDKIEDIIRDLEFDSNDKLLINYDTTERLKLVIFEFKGALSDTQWNRIGFLMKQSLGDRNGGVFYDLVKNYYLYQKEYVEHINTINQSTYSNKLALLKKSQSNILVMQSKYFGSDIAIKLFSRINTTSNYLNSRRIVNMENGLNNSQKKERLLLLSDSYKKTVSQW